MNAVTNRLRSNSNLQCICSGLATYQKDCGCKLPHSIYQDCADPHSGSCYHNEHSDRKFHEEGHELYTE